MNLKTAIENELRRLGAAGGTLCVAWDDGTFEAELATVDTVGCTFRRLSWLTPKLQDATPQRLQQISQSLTGRLTYLLEPISPVEVDAHQCVVQMRSSPPSRDEAGTSYYELVVERGGRLDLRRYSRAPGQPRTTIDAHVTREVFVRLASDMVAAAE